MKWRNMFGKSTNSGGLVPDNMGGGLVPGAIGTSAPLGGATGWSADEYQRALQAAQGMQNARHDFYQEYMARQYGYGNAAQAALPKSKPIKDATTITAAMLDSPEFGLSITAARDVWAARFSSRWVKRSEFSDEDAFLRICFRLTAERELEEVYLYDANEHAYKLRG